MRYRWARLMGRWSTLACFATSLAVAVCATAAGPVPARADGLTCVPGVTYKVTGGVPTPSVPTPSTPSPGHPCWTEATTDLPQSSTPPTAYPFGSDGNPVVDPDSDLCLGGVASGDHTGPGWSGDFDPQGNGSAGNPPCYLQVTSLAFRAWNRGLAATGQPSLHPDP